MHPTSGWIHCVREKWGDARSRQRVWTLVMLWAAVIESQRERGTHYTHHALSDSERTLINVAINYSYRRTITRLSLDKERPPNLLVFFLCRTRLDYLTHYLPSCFLCPGQIRMSFCLLRWVTWLQVICFPFLLVKVRVCRLALTG